MKENPYIYLEFDDIQNVRQLNINRALQIRFIKGPYGRMGGDREVPAGYI